MNVQKVSKAIAAGVGAGVAAFVPLSTANGNRWSIAADIGAAIAAGIFTAVTTYFAPANKPDGGS